MRVLYLSLSLSLSLCLSQNHVVCDMQQDVTQSFVNVDHVDFLSRADRGVCTLVRKRTPLAFLGTEIHQGMTEFK